ncbi:ABC transporter ATP-binding protein [Bradyrhizobium sp. STM 3809]|uniref:ABC transporter ATP-binding protein n=1 Tax=Bradyrhizobium sp. STM 3809 TaxID=551936 RepID=UPI000240A30F|nr:ABC transporter ATP-binding protein [Bradyrhizobium sp. STM 3809]CCE03398.1 ABC transporter, ATPase subunit [Bradyrhizobium sp. STM 3809]
MISAERLTRQYGSFTAVDDVSFEVGDGEIVGLLGHNGAGKTTIMKMLTGYLEPTAGTATIHGHDIAKQRRQAQALIGYLPENCPLYPEMTVVEFLDYAAELRGIPPGTRAQALRDAIAATGLAEKATAPIASLSRGYRQRTGVAQAILHKPKIVILDEPTNGLDPSQIAQMRGLIRDLAKTATVILSTHILQEVRAVCERVLVINRGRLALDTRMSDLGGPGRLRLVTSGPPELVEPLVAGLGLVKSVERLTAAEPGHAYALNLNGHAASAVAPAVARVITDNKLDLFALHPEQRDLETLFADITGAGAPTREAQHA